MSFFLLCFDSSRGGRRNGDDATLTFGFDSIVGSIDQHKLNGFREAMNAHLGGKGLSST